MAKSFEENQNKWTLSNMKPIWPHKATIEGPYYGHNNKILKYASLETDLKGQ